MKIVSIVGARPQFIKLAPLDKKIRERYEHLIVHTGQHYDYELSKAFFDELEISEPDYNLEIGSGSHAWQTGQMLSKVGETLEKTKPDLVLVYGDTNSTLAGALAAVKLHIPTGHIEAGYRSHDISMPEEINRVLTDRISQLLFAPTKNAVKNLTEEGIPSNQIFMVGNIMIESLLRNLNKIKRNPILEELNLKPKQYALLTVHRPENTNSREKLTNIVESLMQVPLPIIFPAHPRTVQYLQKYGLKEKLDNSQVRCLPPLGYIELLKLEFEARFVITDSGGIQEEALIFMVPCITLRYNTERVETLESNANTLVGADRELIIKRIQEILDGASGKRHVPKNWDTKVSERIISAIESNLHLLEIKPGTFEKPGYS